MELVRAHIFEAVPKYGLKRLPCYGFPMQFWTREVKILADSASFKTAIWRQSTFAQCPILAEPSMLEKNSSEMADFEADHFGTKETKDRFLWAKGGVVVNRCLKR
jgi:hypothetical protein